MCACACMSICVCVLFQFLGDCYGIFVLSLIEINFLSSGFYFLAMSRPSYVNFPCLSLEESILFSRSFLIAVFLITFNSFCCYFVYGCCNLFALFGIFFEYLECCIKHFPKLVKPFHPLLFLLLESFSHQC